MADPVEAYFARLRDIRASGAGVAETTYYPAVKALIDEVGKSLKPKVVALMQLRNAGGGLPDGGLFTAGQLKGWDPGVEPMAGQKPQRGAIKIKGTGDDAFAVAKSKQVARYVEHYGLVLVTNLRDFVLVGRGAEGTGIRELESCRLAETEAGFWARVDQPRKYAEAAGEGLMEFLRRALLHDAPLTDPKDVAWFLASYARTARLRLEQKRELPALDALRAQLEESLGLKFEGEKGDHFFRSTLVQTLFYGMFASWVLWARDRDHTREILWDQRFQWETASTTLHVPMVAELFYQFTNPGKLKDLGVSEVLEWAEEVIWRIDRAAFFQKFREEHAVQYFYEPFLEAFDPQLRKELGVWYTPDEVVKYMVARVDWALREELGIADGLADPSVVVLDPCCGTGAYLVEVLRKIDETLQAKGADALTRQDVKRAAMERVIGFEIMPAPFVVAHLQLGILLAELGVPLRDADERAAVYLTNALTGWRDAAAAPPKDKRVGPGQMHSTVLFPEFAEERDAADRIKREEQILVVIGNPPYNSFAGTSPAQEEGLVDPYKAGLGTKWGLKKYNLDDLYVRFVRLAERAIAERTGAGVVCLISNSSYVSKSSFVVMRERLHAEFDSIWIDNLNGDSRETGKLTPSGEPDPSIFSTDRNREGIRVGTAIGLFVRGHPHASIARVLYRDLWGCSKRQDLLAPLAEGVYETVSPVPENRYQFRPWSGAGGYIAWPLVTEIAAEAPLNGPVERRNQAFIEIDRDRLESRMRAFFNHDASDEEVALLSEALMTGGGPGKGIEVRRALLSRFAYDDGRIVPYMFKPFDLRWCYLDNLSPLFSRPSPGLIREAGVSSNEYFVTRDAADKSRDGVPFFWSSAVCDYHALDGEARHFPLLLSSKSRQPSLLDGGSPSANVAEPVAAFLRNADLSEPGTVWLHSLAIGYSSLYLDENRVALRADWPRIPIPRVGASMAASARLGRRVADLLDPTSSAACIVDVGVLSAAHSGALQPSELAVSGQWGILGRGGITMPGPGSLIERDYGIDERLAVAESAKSLGMSPDQAIALLGETCFDVYINDIAYWSCVPANVWRYTIGGYQVIKKWLSYRELALLGRDLKPEEARYITEMVRRIAALVLMQPELDANYERVKADVWTWNC